MILVATGASKKRDRFPPAVYPRAEQRVREAVERWQREGGKEGGCLIIECHADPEHALTDGAQSITPRVLAALAESLQKIAAAVDRQW